MSTLEAGGLLTLVILIWLAGIALGIVSFRLVERWLDRAACRP